MNTPKPAAKPTGTVQRNLGRLEGTRMVRPARVTVGNQVYELHADGTVYSVQVMPKPIPGKPGYLQAKATSRRVKDPRVVREVQQLYKEQAGPR